MPNRRTVLAAIVSLPLLASCSGTGSRAPELALDRVWDRPVPWDAGRGIDYLVDRLSLVGNTVLYAEGAEREPERITALDAATGAERWSIKVGQSITAPTVGRVRLSGCGRVAAGSFGASFQNPLLRAVGDILPLPYVSDDGAKPASGVIGVRLTTGEPVWGVATSEPSADRPVITAVSDACVIITVTPEVGIDWPAADAPVTTIAVDGRTGRTLWSAPDVLGLGADGEFVVVGQRELRAGSRAVWTLRTLAAGTGEQRWADDQELRYLGDHRATAAGYTVLNGYRVFRLATGERIDYEAEAQPLPIMTDPPLLAWDAGDDWWSPWSSGFFTQVLPDGKPQHGRGRPGGLEFDVRSGVGPYVWGELTGTQGTWESDADLIGVAALDRSGTPRSPSLHGILAAVNDRWLITVDSKGFATYRIAPA
ncbi:hypothetical protein [Microlunatus sp. GCM10028923]|uniref:hypothetical protein n=1 Tax=Microlunatus sp. GCM10028923 TaxID=3273400 RepID=UPI003615397C